MTVADPGVPRFRPLSSFGPVDAPERVTRAISSSQKRDIPATCSPSLTSMYAGAALKLERSREHIDAAHVEVAA